MSKLSINDLNALPKPQVVKQHDFETILARKKQELKSRCPQWNADTESDPSVKNLEVSAFDEVVLEQRVNDAATAVMLPWAKNEDLDNLAVFFDEKRRVIIPANPDAKPPQQSVMESNEAFKKRLLLKWSSISTAGPRKSWIFHTLSASTEVKDANAYRISPGRVEIPVLTNNGDGRAASELLSLIDVYVNDEDIRPLCSHGIFKSANIINWSLNAEITVSNTLIKQSILNEVTKNAQDYAESQHKLEGLISLSALNAALHIKGVENVTLLSPLSKIVCLRDEAPFCTEITIQVITL